MTYRIPDSWDGKTLRQIESETNSSGGYFPDIGTLANMLGVDPGAPLKKGTDIQVSTADQGSGEVQFIQKNLKEVTADVFASDIVKAQQETIGRETNFLKQYAQTNPFVFDEQLAKQSATAEYQPYYSELLSDYTKNVDSQRQTVQDEQKLSSTLYKLDTQNNSNAYNTAVGQAEQGFAGQGLFFSGIKDRAVGQATVGYKNATDQAAATEGTQQAGYTRSIEGLNTAQANYARDTGRQQEADIQSGILTRQNEAQKAYYSPLVQSYYRQFPTDTGNVLSGYVPADYLTL